jgi:hypothetical protein
VSLLDYYHAGVRFLSRDGLPEELRATAAPGIGWWVFPLANFFFQSIQKTGANRL